MTTKVDLIVGHESGYKGVDMRVDTMIGHEVENKGG